LIFIDTSALLKRYISETGTDAVIRLMDAEPRWAASQVTLTEAKIALCRAEPGTDASSERQRRLDLDWDRFTTVPTDADCLAMALKIGCDHPLRTLDAIHLAAALRLPAPVAFLSFDRGQAEVAAALGLDVVPVGS
jgi:predicted nucleic acid-binding protein